MTTMRTLKRLVYVFLVAALLAVPLAAVAAQSGTGDSGDIYVPLNLPAPGETELTLGELAPSALPETGASKIAEPAIKNWRYEGFTLVPDWVDTAEPGALPQTGNARSFTVTADGMMYDSATWDDTSYAPDLAPSDPPVALPQTGVDVGLSGAVEAALSQLAARGFSVTSAQAGTFSSRTVNLGGITGPARQTISDQLAASGFTVAD